jgi:hypothetical protein
MAIGAKDMAIGRESRAIGGEPSRFAVWPQIQAVTLRRSSVHRRPIAEFLIKHYLPYRL